MSRYSDRAKRNMRRQINAQIRLLVGLARDKYREWQRAKRYRKYRLPGQKQMERVMWNGYKKACVDLGTIVKRKQKLSKAGKI